MTQPRRSCRRTCRSSISITPPGFGRSARRWRASFPIRTAWSGSKVSRRA